MAGPVAGWGDDMAARGRLSRMRVSHEDRENVIDTLKAAYAYGLLTKDEFDTRVSQTFASRTYAELALVTDDIPAGLPAAPQPPDRAPAAATAPLARRAGWVHRVIVATALFAVLAYVAATVTDDGYIGLAAATSALASLFLTGTRALGSRRGTGSHRQLPPPEAHSGLRADPGTASATAEGRLPRSGKQRWRHQLDAGQSGLLRPNMAAG